MHVHDRRYLWGSPPACSPARLISLPGKLLKLLKRRLPQGRLREARVRSQTAQPPRQLQAGPGDPPKGSLDVAPDRPSIPGSQKLQADRIDQPSIRVPADVLQHPVPDDLAVGDHERGQNPLAVLPSRSLRHRADDRDDPDRHVLRFRRRAHFPPRISVDAQGVYLATEQTPNVCRKLLEPLPKGLPIVVLKATVGVDRCCGWERAGTRQGGGALSPLLLPPKIGDPQAIQANSAHPILAGLRRFRKLKLAGNRRVLELRLGEAPG